MSQTPQTDPRLRQLSLSYRGDFDLALSVRRAQQAVFVDRDASDAGHLDLAFLVEGTWAPVAARVEQSEGGGPVHAQLHDNPKEATDEQLRDGLERILSLAPDGRALDDVAGADPVARSLVDRFRGLRPIAYPSPYEAAARAIIGHRLALPAAAAAFARVAEGYGTALHLDGREFHAFAEPDRLAQLMPVRGLSERKLSQLRSLGEVAAGGELDSDDLMSMDRAAAMARLQGLPGIGPFSAELIMIRGCGDPDLFPRTEGRLHRAIAELYDLGADPELTALESAAEPWRPFRSWIGLMARSATDDRSTGSASTRDGGRAA